VCDHQTIRLEGEIASTASHTPSDLICGDVEKSTPMVRQICGFYSDLMGWRGWETLAGFLSRNDYSLPLFLELAMKMANGFLAWSRDEHAFWRYRMV
jgi:hypothetical protein